MKFIRQQNMMDCGPSCIAMVASHYGKILSLEFQLATMIREIYSNLVNDFNAAVIENSFQCKQTLNRKIIDDNIIKIHSSPQYEFILKYFIITLQNISYDDIKNTRCQLEYKYA